MLTMGGEIKPTRFAASDASDKYKHCPFWRWAAAALKALAAALRGHVHQAEAQRIPAAQPAATAQGVDLMALGAVIVQRRGELQGDQGVD